jgi:hypothetical protein
VKNVCYCQYGLLTDDDLPRPDDDDALLLSLDLLAVGLLTDDDLPRPDDDDALLLSLDLLAVGCKNALPRVDSRSMGEDTLSSILPIVVMV